MPLYVFRCKVCKLEFEEFRHNYENMNSAKCGFCGGEAVRAHDKEIPHVIPDIEPRYDIGLGEHVTSRKDYREKLAYNNAWSPDLFYKDNPNDGRLVKEERAELESRPVTAQGTVFEKRNRPGWGGNPSDEDSIQVEGKADYEVIKKHIINQHERRLENGE